MEVLLKRTLVLIFILGLSTSSIGQESQSAIKFGFASSSTGNHIRLGYSFGFGEEKQSFVALGTKYLLYVKDYNGNGVVYTRRFYGQDFWQNFGLFFEVGTTIWDTPENVSAYIKFDGQANKTGIKNEYLTATGPDGQPGEAVVIKYRTDPFWNLESSVMIGLDSKISENISFFVEGGGG